MPTFKIKMAVLLPMFPLQVVVYPNEKVPLHIFEERYKQLIADCETDQIPFGVPTYLDGKMEYGTELTLEKVVNRHPNGSLDVVCRGQRVFRIDDFFNPYPGKLYAGADVTYRADMGEGDRELRRQCFELIQKLFMLIDAKTYDWFEDFTSYTFAHVVGFSVKQEYQMLTFPKEDDRLQFMILHLNTTIPVVNEMNRTRKMIQMNGHFRNYDPLDFKEFKLN